MESAKTRLDAFPSLLHPSNFFLKILFLVPKVSNSWIFQKRCFMELIWHRISIQTLLFQTCYFSEAMFLWKLFDIGFPYTNTVISNLLFFRSDVLWKLFDIGFPYKHCYFSEAMFLWKLFDIGFPYKHCYFKPVCLPVKMASKTVIRPIPESN